MSGNGIYEQHNCTKEIDSTAVPPVNCIPPGEGGGWVETGAFKDHTANLAPVFPSLKEPESNGSLPFWSSDPRCLKRDVSVWVSSKWTKDDDIADLMTQNADLYLFQTIMRGMPSLMVCSAVTL